MKSFFFPAILLLVLVVSGCTRSQEESPSTDPETVDTSAATEVPYLSNEAAAELTYNARRFMEDYAYDIRQHDGAAVAARYHPSGTYFKGSLMDQESIFSSYTDGWQGPSAFEWRNLDFEILGPDAVLATGTGLWGMRDTNQTMNVMYASVLVRHEGEWKIRVEDETVLED